MSSRSKRVRGGRGSTRRTLSMSEFQTALANMRPEQRDALFRMFPERKEPAKLPEKVTKRQLRKLWGGLETLMDMPSRAVEFAYAVVQNRHKIADEIKKFDILTEPSDAWKAFDAARLAVCEEFANKDEQGKPVHDGVQYAIPSDKRGEFDRRAAEVREEYKEAIEAYQARAETYEKLLDEEIPCPKLVLIPMRALPPGLTPRQLEPLQIILE